MNDFSKSLVTFSTTISVTLSVTLSNKILYLRSRASFRFPAEASIKSLPRCVARILQDGERTPIKSGKHE